MGRKERITRWLLSLSTEGYAAVVNVAQTEAALNSLGRRLDERHRAQTENRRRVDELQAERDIELVRFESAKKTVAERLADAGLTSEERTAAESAAADLKGLGEFIRERTPEHERIFRDDIEIEAEIAELRSWHRTKQRRFKQIVVQMAVLSILLLIIIAAVLVSFFVLILPLLVELLGKLGPSAPYVGGGTVLLLGLALYQFRRKQRRLYAVTEVLAGTFAAFIASRNLVGGPSPEAYLQLAGSAYLIVRGCDNFVIGQAAAYKALEAAEAEFATVPATPPGNSPELDPTLSE